MVKYHKKHFILWFLFFVTNSIVFGQKPDTILFFKFPTLPKTNYYIATGKLPTPMCSVYLPENYNEIKKIPVLLWIDGGTGGAGGSGTVIGTMLGALLMGVIRNGLVLLNVNMYWQTVATGAIIIGTLLDELERSGKGTGLATLCIASGMGAATIIERV